MAGISTQVTPGDPITESGSTVAEDSHPLADAGQQASETVSRLAGRATDIGLQQADRGREQAAQGIESVAQGIRRLSTDLQVDQPAIAGAADTAAEQAERVAMYLRNNDVRDMLAGVEDAARRQPLLFLGGAFVLGIAASRFLKAAAGSNQAGRRLSGSELPYTYQATGPGSSTGAEGI